jgi:5,10-methylenetetrahydromethanopterin reductase
MCHMQGSSFFRGLGDYSLAVEMLIVSEEPVEQMAHRARFAEAHGFDTIWLADERFYRDVYACLAIIASETSTVRLGPCVTDPFIRHPALTAVAMATLDEISGNRAILGIGAGISGFRELGIEPKRAPRAIREAIDLIRKLWTGETVDYKGEIVRFSDGHLHFTPGRADIPVAVASNGPLGQRAAGALAGKAIMAACASLVELKAFRSEVETGAKQAGRPLTDIDITVRLNTCIADDGAVARDTLRLGVARYIGNGAMKMSTLGEQDLELPKELLAGVADIPYGASSELYRNLLPFVTDRHVDAFTLAGTVEEVTARVVALRQAGVNSIIIRPFGSPMSTIDDTIRRFGTDVWPRAQAELAV